MKIRTRQIVKYVLMLETLPLAGDEFYELMENARCREKRINTLREKLLMPESYYPFKQP